MSSPMWLKLLEKIVTVLFSRQSTYDHHIEQIDEAEIQAITMQELRTCSKVGNAKPPGIDGIPNIALKVAIEEAPEVFLSTYNRCLQEGIFPVKWKQQRLVLLPKGKKPPDEPSFYCPLCMLDTAGKIFERIIHGRIEEYSERHLSNNQFGFRKGRFTLGAIKLGVDKASTWLAARDRKKEEKEYCLVLTLDIKNALNSARWDSIMKALAKMNVPGCLKRTMQNYFWDQILKYDTDVGPKTYVVTRGVPQGSVLEPLLWNIMYDEASTVEYHAC